MIGSIIRKYLSLFCIAAEYLGLQGIQWWKIIHFFDLLFVYNFQRKTIISKIRSDSNVTLPSFCMLFPTHSVLHVTLRPGKKKSAYCFEIIRIKKVPYIESSHESYSPFSWPRMSFLHSIFKLRNSRESNLKFGDISNLSKFYRWNPKEYLTYSSNPPISVWKFEVLRILDQDFP